MGSAIRGFGMELRQNKAVGFIRFTFRERRPYILADHELGFWHLPRPSLGDFEAHRQAFGFAVRGCEILLTDRQLRLRP